MQWRRDGPHKLVARFGVMERVQCRPSATGGIPGPCPPNGCLCPPNENCAPPSKDCAPKKLTGLGLLECKSRPNWRFLWTENGFLNVFGMKTFFFLKITCFRPVKLLKFTISGKKFRAILVKPFFFFLEITCFRPENLFESLLLTLFT